MKYGEFLIRATCVRAQLFLDEHAGTMAAVNASGARKALDQVVQEFDGHAATQGEHLIGSTGETQKQRSIRLTIRRQYLKPIAKVAQAQLADVPEIATLRLPRPKLVGTQLVETANGIANAAEKHKDVFVNAGLTPDFLEGLRKLAQQLQESIDGRTSHVGKRMGATIAIGSVSVRARRVLRTLDGVVHQNVTDAGLLAEWDAVKRVAKKPGVARGAAIAAADTPTNVTPLPGAAAPAEVVTAA